MTDVTGINQNTLKYEYKKQQGQAEKSEEEFDVEMDSAGYKAAVDKNKGKGGSGPAYVLQLSEEARRRLESE